MIERTNINEMALEEWMAEHYEHGIRVYKDEGGDLYKCTRCDDPFFYPSQPIDL